MSNGDGDMDVADLSDLARQQDKMMYYDAKMREKELMVERTALIKKIDALIEIIKGMPIEESETRHRVLKKYEELKNGLISGERTVLQVRGDSLLDEDSTAKIRDALKNKT